MANQDNFTNLHTHSSAGSMIDSMMHIDDMFMRVSDLGQKSLAITDHGTMAGVFDAHKAAKKYGIKYIPGIEAYFCSDVKEKQKRRHLVLLAKNEVGYKNLLRLNWYGHLSLQYVAVLNKVFPVVDWNMLEKYNEGLICLTACGSGILASQMFERNENGEWLRDICDAKIEETAQRLKNIFGNDLYLELQPHSLKIYSKDRKTGEFKLDKNGDKVIIIDQDYINLTLIELGRKLNIPLVATTDAHYLDKDDAKIHDMLMAIRDRVPLSNKTRHRYEVDEFYIKSSKEIIEHFTKLVGSELALELCNNSMKIANKCEDSDYLEHTETRFPQFNLKDEPDYDDFLKWNNKQKNKAKQETHAFMRYRCVKGFKEKYGHLRGTERKKYIKRMMNEIEVFELRNFCSYMLIVSDFIRAAKKQNIPIGPGRGSVGGSFVANLLDIHTVDPIKYGLLFERFHNKEKKAYPDIDTDISPNGRDWVEQYIVNKYGKDKVAHVSNLSRMTPKVVIKDIARSLELGGSKSEAFKIANKITDSIPENCDTFDEALSKSAEFRRYCARYPELEKYGRKLTGLEKAYATHAAGVVIGDVPLSTYVPLRIDKNGSVSVQYDKDRCEDEGLIKIDLLGLEHLKIIDNTIKNARSLGLDCPNPDDVTLYDKNVWESISKGQTMCVFQMESPHMKALCKLIKPKNVEDLSIINALGRPAAGKRDKKGNRPAPRNVYILRRDGKEKVSARYDCLENSLKETLGICVYEEQLMNLAADSAGWDRNVADGLRKLTKLKGKNPEFAKKLENDFIKDTMTFSNLSETQARDIWDNVIEPFSGYGFNKSIQYNETIDIFDKDSKFINTITIKEVFENKDKINMYVKSRDENSKKEILCKISNVYNHGKIDISEFEMDNGKKIRCTMNHKFRVIDGRMLPIKQIIYEKLKIVCGQDSTKVKTFMHIGKEQTYDLEIDHKDHQFYLSGGLLTSNSHGILYSINGYHSAYYKYYYPAAFMAAVLKSEVEKSSSPVRDSNIRAYKKEAKRLGIEIKAPDINFSGTSFTVLDEKTIVTGLAAVKGVGEKAVVNIIQERERHTYKSFADFLFRTSSSLVRKNVIQPLAKAGCFDNLGITRKNAFEHFNTIRTKANKHHKRIIDEGRDQWSILDDFTIEEIDKDNEWSLKEKLQWEQETLGEYISGTANDIYDGFFTGQGITPLSKIKSLPANYSIRIEAFITDIKQAKTRSGKNIGSMRADCVLQDIDTNTAQLKIWSDRWIKYKNILSIGRPIRAVCKTNIWENNVSLVLERVEKSI